MSHESERKYHDSLTVVRVPEGLLAHAIHYGDTRPVYECGVFRTAEELTKFMTDWAADRTKPGA